MHPSVSAVPSTLNVLPWSAQISTVGKTSNSSPTRPIPGRPPSSRDPRLAPAAACHAASCRQAKALNAPLLTRYCSRPNMGTTILHGVVVPKLREPSDPTWSLLEVPPLKGSPRGIQATEPRTSKSPPSD